MNTLIKSSLGIVVGGLLTGCVCHTQNDGPRAMLGQTQSDATSAGIAMNNVYFRNNM